jgi:surfeit locus 1 family protein
MTIRALAVPVTVTLLGLALLIGLGKWQLDRREWKLGIIERIEGRIHDEAISLTMAKQIWQKSLDIDYYRVLLVGRLHHDQERHLYSILDGQAGWNVITPLETSSGDVVLVDRGFVPERLKEPASRARGQVEEVVEMTGLARSSQKRNWFTPENEPAANRWFWRDVRGMIASLPPGLGERAVPFLVDAEAAPVPGNWPRAGVTVLNIPNRHLGYALTWFGLAAALIAVFIVYARGRLAGRARHEDAIIAERESKV